MTIITDPLNHVSFYPTQTLQGEIRTLQSKLSTVLLKIYCHYRKWSRPGYLIQVDVASPHWRSLPVYLYFKAALEVHPLLLIEPSVGDNLRGHFLS